MSAFLFILGIAILLIVLLRKDKNTFVPRSKKVLKDDPPKVNESRTIVEPQKLTITRSKLFHRKTYVRGKLTAKYYGELDIVKDSEEYVREKYYDFTLYDATITEAKFRKNNDGPFPEFNNEDLFPGNIQPNPLPCTISYEGIEGVFTVSLRDLKLANVFIDPLLHQVEDDEVFGTLTADITGYLLEEFTEETTEEIELPRNEPVTHLQHAVSAVPSLYKTTEKTGRTKTEGNYTWDEFYMSDRKARYWGSPKFTGRPESGILSGIGLLFGLLVLVLFIVALWPFSLIGILGLLFVILVTSYLSEVLVWIFRIVAGLFLLGVFLSIISEWMSVKKSRGPVFVKDEITETKVIRPDTLNNTNDSLIIHHRVWKDYTGQQYEGDIWVRKKDLQHSSNFKNLNISAVSSFTGYDAMLSELSQQDINKLAGVYQLFDSLKAINNIDSVRFAEIIVSFVQDIPYSLVLDKDCDPSLYRDRQVKEYLIKGEGDCYSNQRFGINTPLEFMVSLKGDCDTRTLLLYTILSHYGYDVAILSSELYAHSILGINLPFTGKSMSTGNRIFTVWETTAPGLQPGLLTEEISDFNNWRFSLQSKL